MGNKTLIRIDVLRAALFGAVFYAGFGLVIGMCIALVALLGSAAGVQADDHGPAAVLAMMGIGAVVIVPIIYGVIGFVGCAVAAVLYNLVARVMGGLRFEISE